MADKYRNQEEARCQAAKGSFQVRDIKHTGISKGETSLHNSSPGGESTACGKCGAQMEELEKTLKDLKVQLENMEEKKDVEERKRIKENSSLRNEIAEKDEEIKKRKQENLDHWKEKETSLEEKETRLRKTKEEHASVLKDKETEFNSLMTKMRSQHQEIKELHEKLKREKENVQEMLIHYEGKIKELLNELSREQDNMEKSSKRQRKIVENMQKELNHEKETVNKKSLSRMAAAQLTDNNPNIADLSDENRPTKLGERYAELYDNQWTDAFSELAEEHHVNERDAIDLLKDILVEGDQRCKEYATSQLQSYKTQIKDLWFQEWKFKLKDFKDARKKHHMVPQDLEKDFRKIVTTMLKEKGATEQKAQMQDTHNYMDEVLNLCWLSQVQDPPMAISWDYQSRSTFPGNLFKAYTETGDLLDFVVWPALFLHQDGPVINKGVAQGLKTKKQKTDETKEDNVRKQKKQPGQKMGGNASTLADLKREMTTPSEQSSSSDIPVMGRISTQRSSVYGAQNQDGSKSRMPAEGENPGAMHDGQRTADNNTHRDAGNKTSRSSHSDQQAVKQTSTPKDVKQKVTNPLNKDQQAVEQTQTTPKSSNPAFPGKIDGATPVSAPKGSINDWRYRQRHNPGTTTEKQNTALSVQNSPRVTEDNKRDQGDMWSTPLLASIMSKIAPGPHSKEQPERKQNAV